MNFVKPKGTKDIFKGQIEVWQYFEKTVRELCEQYNFAEIRVPVFESTELFKRGVGDDTDVVNKEMYTFLDKGNRSITLRPEFTAGVMRAYIENGMSSMPSPLKYWYVGNVYRYEKMQKGRYREFNQFGIELLGTDSYLADIECILVAYNIFKRIGMIEDLDLCINSIGCTECRAKYVQALKDYVLKRVDNMCDTCKSRLDKNAMRIIDCKEEKCQANLKEVPYITDYICESCSNDFEKFKSLLTKLDIPYKVDKKIVRGLDYYNKTVFEYVSKDLGISVCGGGRYDGLITTLGGKATPGVGFAMGVDRTIMILEEQEKIKNMKKEIDVYFSVIDERAYDLALKVTTQLRDSNFVIDFEMSDRNINSSLKYANKLNSKFVCIIGEEEYKNQKCILKNMEDGTQQTISCNYEDICKIISK